MKMRQNAPVFGTMAVLAGGKSSRMGFDKALLSIDGVKMTDKIIDTLSSDFSEVIVSSNHKGPYLQHQVLYIPDEFIGKGPLSGIYSVLKAASSRFVYVIACDMPNINLEYIRYMKNLIETSDFDVCCAKCNEGFEPFNAFYSTKCIPALLTHLENDSRRFTDFIKSLNCLVINENDARHFSPDWSMFKNVNTPSDLADLSQKLTPQEI